MSRRLAQKGPGVLSRDVEMASTRVMNTKAKMQNDKSKFKKGVQGSSCEEPRVMCS